MRLPLSEEIREKIRFTKMEWDNNYNIQLLWRKMQLFKNI